MVITKNLKIIILFFSCLYPTVSLPLGSEVLNTLWQHCTLSTFNKTMTVMGVGTHLWELSEFAQLNAYTYKNSYPIQETLQGVKENIQRIADDLNIDISGLKIKKMSKAEKCAASLGIEATRNFIFVHEEALIPSEDAEGNKILDYIEPPFDFSDQNDPVVTFLIRQILLKWHQAFYTKRVLHRIVVSLLQSAAVSKTHSFLTGLISPHINPSFGNAWAQWGWNHTMNMANMGLSFLLFGLSSACIKQLNSFVNGTVSFDIVKKAADFEIAGVDKISRCAHLRKKLSEKKSVCKDYAFFNMLIEKQIEVLDRIREHENKTAKSKNS